MSLKLVAGESGNQGGPFPASKSLLDGYLIIVAGQKLWGSTPHPKQVFSRVSFDPTKAFEPDGARKEGNEMALRLRFFAWGWLAGRLTPLLHGEEMEPLTIVFTVVLTLACEVYYQVRSR